MVTAPVRHSSLWLCCAILLGLALPAAAAPTRKVSIDTEPSGATVYVGEKEAGPAGVTPVLLDLPLGDNVIIIERENYVPKFEVLTVPKGKGKPVKVTYKLDPGSGAIVVATDAAGKGAKVLIDDEDKGSAPGRIEVPAGMHRVEIVAKGKTIYSDTVEVGVGVDTSIYAKGGSSKGGSKEAKELKEGKGKKPKEPKEPKDPEKVLERDPPSDDEPSLEPSDTGERGATEISARDRDDDPDRLEIKRRPRDEERSAAPAGPRRWRVAPLFEVGYRYFDYTSVVTTRNLPALRQRGATLFGLRAEGRPLRSLAGLKVAAAGGYGIPQQLQTSVGPADSVWWRGEADVSYRLGLGAHVGVTALVGYGVQRFRFVGSPALGTSSSPEALVPAATYHLARLGLGVGYSDGPLEVGLQVENHPVLAGGAFAERFRSASADGLAGRLTALYSFGRFFGRLDGDYARYAWTFGYDQNDLYQAGGATDKLFGFSLALGASF